MAKLTFSEIQLIESVFDMSSGYVLNFSNRTFQQFMDDVVSYNIYEKYPGLSKANILRQFIKDESDSYVGKAIILLINYMQDHELVKDGKLEKVNKLLEFGEKLLGKTPSRSTNKNSTKPNNKTEIDYENLTSSLFKIDSISNKQARGYAFEKYLNELFKAFGLSPNASYRTEYDQIDGSFKLNDNTILLEAKYKSHEIPKDDLILFTNKIESKSHFVKGLFITFSHVDKKAIEYFTDRSSRIIVLTVEEIFILCQNKMSLQTILENKFRILDERGLIYKHILTF